MNDMVRSTGKLDAFVTIQRLKIQNSQRNGVRLGNYLKKLDRYFTMVDVWVYNCCNNNVEKCIADAGVYYMNADFGFIRHCVVERSKGHGFKIGDGASDMVLEWSIANGAGWYPNYDGGKTYMGHPTALDFPHDKNNGFRLTCRYCIGTNSNFYGVQIRRIRDFSFHHNEVFNTLHFDDIKDSDIHSVGRHQVIIFAGHTSGDFTANIIHDPGASGTNAIYVSACGDDAPVINITDNVIYGNHKQGIRCHYSNKTAVVNIRGNRIFSYGPSAALGVFGRIGNRLTVKDNVLCLAEPGACLDVVEGGHSGNRYWFPKGKRGVALGEGESDADPGWRPLPVGPLTPEMFAREGSVLKGVAP